MSPARCPTLAAAGALALAACTWAADAPGGDASRPQDPAASAPRTDAALPAAPTYPSSLAPTPAKRQALVVGSSSIKSTFGRIIAADLESWGLEVARHGIVSAGLARPDLFNLRELVAEMPIDTNTAAVFVYVGVNDGQALWLHPSERGESGYSWLPWHDPRWDEVYTRRAQDLFRSICDRGAQRTIVLLPIEVDKANLERKMQRIRRLQGLAAKDTTCAAAVSTLGDRGQFSRGGKALRRRDGVHMSPQGARIIWNRVRQRVKPLLPYFGAQQAAPPDTASLAPPLADDEL